MIVYILKDDKTLDFVYNCPPDVMEKGKYLLPSIPYSTIAPPSTNANEAAIFKDGKWKIVPDFRGLTYFLNGIQYKIEELGETIPENANILPEPVNQNSSSELVVSPWQIRQALNELGLRQQVENLVKSTTDQNIKDGWEFATEWREFHPFVQSLGSKLNLTKSQIHVIFVLAKEK